MGKGFDHERAQDMRPLLIAALTSLCGISLFGSTKQRDLDQMVLDQLKKVGSDLSKPHEIEFFLYFPTQTAAAEASAKVEAAGFHVEVRPAAKGPGWLCKGTKKLIPELKALQKIRKDFTAIAAAGGGEYDGWGTEVVK
jgi:hypothetical protein